MSRIGEWSKALHLYERQVAVVQGTITQLLFWDGQSDLRPQPVTLEADESTRASKKKKKRRTQKGAAAVDEAVDFIDPYDEDDSFVFGEMVVLDNCVQEGVLPSSPNAFLPMNALGDPVCQNGWWQLTIAGLNKTVRPCTVWQQANAAQRTLLMCCLVRLNRTSGALMKNSSCTV